MLKRDHLSCNSLLFEYSRNGLHTKVLDFFLERHSTNESFNESSFSHVLKVCGFLSNHFLGMQLHCHCYKCGLKSDVGIGTSLVDMYMKCEHVEYARRIFERMPQKNVVTWSSLLAGYVQNAYNFLVHDLFVRMRVEGIKPNEFTFVAVLGASAAERLIEKGKETHSQLVKSGFAETIFLGNSLMNMYSKCGAMEDAKLIFEYMERRTIVSWNTMVAGFVQNGLDFDALELFSRMIIEGLDQTQMSFAVILKSCANLKRLALAKQLHSCILKRDFERDENIMTALTVVYCKCNAMDDALKLFSTMTGHQNVVSWTAMINGLIENGRTEEAAHAFCKMCIEGTKPNEFTFSTILTASPIVSTSQIHARVLKTNYQSVPSVGTALLVAYSASGNVDEALLVFTGIDGKDIMAWSAMMAGFAQAGNSEGAIKLFREMSMEAFKPNEYTISSILDACAAPTATTSQGKLLHGLLIKYGYERSICVSSALVHMYAKRGNITHAHFVFNQQTERDLVSWNSMIIGYAQHGRGHKAIDIFNEMKAKNLEMDRLTFMGVLAACVHAGLIEEGQAHFDFMVNDKNINPTMEHYTLLVDLYSRASKMKEAMDIITEMPYPPSASVWRTLLGACRVHRNIVIGKLAAEKLLSLDPQDSAAYVLLSNMYAAAGKWDERAEVRKLMDGKKVKKEAGYSWIEVKNRVHSFLAGDRSHPLSDSIYQKLGELSKRLKDSGYLPDTSFVLHDVDDELKATILSQHSERLAIAFGLITTPQGSPLHIVKNLRVCGDCHAVIKLISAIEGRNIVMRDSNRFHHFSGGSCSCGDYW